MARPFLKWAGGKTQLLRHLLAYAPERFETYHEPFLGGGALFFSLQETGRFASAKLSDINEELINAYLQVRDSVDDLAAALQVHQGAYQQLGQAKRADYYYKIRDKQPLMPVDRAARTIFLNKTCFNGLYRVNSAGLFNVPHGRYQNPTICDVAGLSAASAALQGVDIRVADFSDAVARASVRDFVYFDPPYVPLSDTAHFTAYTSQAFEMSEQRRLADTAADLMSRGVRFLLSNSSHPDVERLYQEKGMSPWLVLAGRMINSDASARGAIRESLICPSDSAPTRRTPASMRERARRTAGPIHPAHRGRLRRLSHAGRR